MGIRGELFSTRITCEGRTYFFNVKQNRMGDVFLTIVESKPTEAENFDRRSIVLFREDVGGFLKAFQGALKFMEKPGSAHKQAALSFVPQPEPDVPLKKPRARKPAAEGGATEGAEPKRRVVVKRKPQAPDSTGETPAE